MTIEQKLYYALEGESGRHPDNVVPCMIGGVVLAAKVREAIVTPKRFIIQMENGQMDLSHQLEIRNQRTIYIIILFRTSLNKPIKQRRRIP